MLQPCKPFTHVTTLPSHHYVVTESTGQRNDDAKPRTLAYSAKEADGRARLTGYDAAARKPLDSRVSELYFGDFSQVN